MSSVAAPFGASTALTDLDSITDEERLRVMWQQAEDFGDRRRIRARMYKLREQRLREMVQNDEESLGTLSTADDGTVTERTETTITVGSDGEGMTTTTTRRSSNIEVKMHVDGDSAVTDSISTQNVRLGGLTMRGMDSMTLEGHSAEDMIKERMRKGSQDRSTRYQRILGELSDDANNEGDAVVSITKSTYSIQSNALAGEGYLSMKNKEVRDSVSPTRIMRERRSSAEEDVSANEGRLTSDDEGVLRTESESRTLRTTETRTTSSSRKSSRDERSSSKTSRTSKSEIPVRSSTARKISDRKPSKELDINAARRNAGDKASPSSPTKRTPGDSSSRIQMTRKTGAQKEAPVTTTKTTVKTTKSGIPSRKSKLAEVEAKMETSIMSELDKLDTYLSASVDDDDEIIMEEEEECLDESGNVVKMLVQTRRKKDGTECTARRVARSTKVVNSESEIDEILIGNPDHEVVERDVTEEEDKDGNKIKIITETRRRPDGIVYTTKNVLKTSKIFDYDHPEDVAYNEDDELISTDKTEETDENGITIQTVTETRRKPSGVEYTTKKVYKTSKVKSTQITPSDDDEVIDTQETEEKSEDGSIIRTVIETRRTKGGEEYTHRQVFRSRRMTLSGVDLQKGLPTIQNDDEVLNKEEKEETDDSGMKIRVVTETRKRKDGSTYSFEYVLRSFQGTEEDVKRMPVGSACSSNIAVSAEDELINEEVKEEVQSDGSTVKTIIERRRTKDGTEYLRHRIMRIPKMPEPVLQVANLEDEVLQEEVNEETLSDGTHYKAVTERRRSSVSGTQYTLRRMSKVYQQASIHPKTSEDEILDENVTEEETDEVWTYRREEKEETDDSGMKIRVVTETRKRKDGSTYSFEYVLRSFQGTEEDVKRMPVGSACSSNIAVSAEDELINEEVKEEVQSDGSTVKTIIERRRTKDGTEYLRHRIMRIPKMPEPVLQVANLEDEVLQEEVNEETLSDGTHYKAVTERRRSSVSGTQYTLRRMSKVYQQASIHPKTSEDEILDENVTEEETDEGTIIKTVIQRYQRPDGSVYTTHNIQKMFSSPAPVTFMRSTIIKTVIQRYQRPDGSVYTTHNIQKMFSSPAPVTFVGTEEDELIDQTVDEEETEDGYIIKTVTETRERSDGVRYTVERTEKTSKHGSQVHISFSENRHQRPEEVVQVSSPDDTLVSSEEEQHEEEDGTIIKTITEIRRRVDGTEYTSKTILRSTPVLVPERETSYVVIRPEDGDDESELFPSLDDEVVYTRKKQETDEYGNAITVIIETRQSKTTGEKYNITKRVHTKDVIMTDEGEREIPKPVKKSTLEARISPDKKRPSGDAPDEEPDNVPYGSVSALKNRFTPGKKSEPTTKSNKPDRVNTSSKKKFFEEAAKTASSEITSLKSSLRKTEPRDKPKDTDVDAKRDLLPSFTDDKASVEVKLRVERDEATVEKVTMQNVTSEVTEETDVTDARETDIKDLDTEIARLEEEENERYGQDDEPEPETDEPDDELGDDKEPEEEMSSPTEDEPQEPSRRRPDTTKKAPVTSRTTRRKPEDEPKKRREVSPRKKPEADEPSRRVPLGSRKAPAKDDSPTRRVPSQRDPVAPKDTNKRAPKTTTSPQRVPSSPARGRSPIRSGVSTPREVTPTGRQCCKRHREANESEPESPTRTQKPEQTSPTRSKKPEPSSPTRRSARSPPLKKPLSPESKPKMNGDVRRPEPRTNGDIGRKPDDKTPRSRRPGEKPSEPDRTTARPTRPSQSPRKSPTTRSPDKREPTRSVPSRTTDKKTPATKPSDRTPKGRSTEPDSKTKPKSGAKEPVVTLPETPMTEDMRPLPSDEEYSPRIEDVSGEPDLPYHTVHRPSIVREPSEYPSDGQEASDSSPEDKPEEPSEEEEPQDKRLTDRKKPVDDEPKDDTIKPRRTRPLESRPSDKNITKEPETSRKKAPDTKQSPRDKPWLTDRKSIFEKKPSDTKLTPSKPDEDKKTPDRRRPFERKPSDEKMKKPKETEKPRDEPSAEDTSPSEDENRENGMPEEAPKYVTPKEKSPEPERLRKRPEEVTSRIIEDVEKSVSSQIISEKKITTTDVAARRSAFDRKTPVDKKKDTPTRKPSYEIKESVFAKRSLFEQPKQDPVPSPIKRPTLKSTIKKDDKPKEPEVRKPLKETKEPEDRKPVKEPKIVPKYFHPLGDGDEEEPVEKTVKEEVNEDIKITSSKLVMSAMASTNQTTTKEVRKTTRRSEEPSDDNDDRPEDERPNRREPFSREGSPAVHSKEASPAPRSKEGSPAPFSKEGSPTRFVTGKPVDSGINPNKIRRIERAGSNKKFFEDLEVSRENLPEYLKTIETIYDITILESMLEKAETYEERRLIRGQMRLAKRPSTTPGTTSSPATYKRFVDMTPSKPSPTASPQPTRRVDKKPEEPRKEPKSDDKKRKPISKSEEPRSSPTTQEAGDTPSTRRPASSRPDPRDRQPEDEPDREPRAEPTPEPTREPEDRRRSPKKDADEEPRRFQEPKKEEEPRTRFGRTTKPTEEPKAEPAGKRPTKTAPANEPYSEPLRYQKGQSRTPAQTAPPQSDVDKIVSAYGVGPTDDKGMPLFGLRALKRRSPAVTETPKEEEPKPEEPRRAPESDEERDPSSEEKPKKDTFEPTDASGRPLFGLRALKKTTTETTKDTSTRDTTTSVVESSRLVSGITKRTTHTTEEVSTTESPRDSDGSESEQDSQADSDEEQSPEEHDSDEEETSPGLVRNLRDSFKKKTDAPEDTRSPGKASPRNKDTPDEEVITKRSQPLKEILKLHESKVQEPTSAEESPRPKPKQKLRDNFEATVEQQETRVHKTWDLETDLSTRSLNMRNIIERHETITAEEAPKPEKKLTGILKKTSSSNILITDTRAEKTTHAESADDILDTLTEDQIAKLSEEFDLRAQEDGVIKTRESMEELSTGYRVTSTTEVDHPEGAKFERKTSYTEIKLQQPSKEEGTSEDDLSDHDVSDEDKKPRDRDITDTYRHIKHTATATVKDTKTLKTTTQISSTTVDKSEWADVISVHKKTTKQSAKPLDKPEKLTKKPGRPAEEEPGKEEPEDIKRRPSKTSKLGRPGDEVPEDVRGKPGKPGRPGEEEPSKRKPGKPGRPGEEEPEGVRRRPGKPGRPGEEEPEDVRRRPGKSGMPGEGEPEDVRRRPGKPGRPGEEEPEDVRRRPGKPGRPGEEEPEDVRRRPGKPGRPGEEEPEDVRRRPGKPGRPGEEEPEDVRRRPGKPGRPGEEEPEDVRRRPGKPGRPGEEEPDDVKRRPGKPGRPREEEPDGVKRKPGKPGRPGEEEPEGVRRRPGKPGRPGEEEPEDVRRRPGKPGRPGEEEPDDVRRRPGKPGRPGEEEPEDVRRRPGKPGRPGEEEPDDVRRRPGKPGRPGEEEPDDVRRRPGKPGRPGEEEPDDVRRRPGKPGRPGEEEPEDVRRRPGKPGRPGEEEPEDLKRRPSKPGRPGEEEPEDLKRRPSKPGRPGEEEPEDLKRRPSKPGRPGEEEPDDVKRRPGKPGRPGEEEPEDVRRRPGKPGRPGEEEPDDVRRRPGKPGRPGEEEPEDLKRSPGKPGRPGEEEPDDVKRRPGKPGRPGEEEPEDLKRRPGKPGRPGEEEPDDVRRRPGKPGRPGEEEPEDLKRRPGKPGRPGEEEPEDLKRRPSKPGRPGEEEPDDVSRRPGKPGRPGEEEPEDLKRRPGKPGRPREEEPEDVRRPGKPGRPGEEEPDDVNRKPGKPGRPGEEEPEDVRRRPGKPGRPGEEEPEDVRRPGKPGRPGEEEPEDVRRRPGKPGRPGEEEPEDVRRRPGKPGRPGEEEPEDVRRRPGK
ncbi:titin-like, partial [Penaeus indicus]|uniref:titin-like n=1 Tax=Penaeus indicus TaxID=29960 RepID=UPI00300CDCFD